MTSEDKTPEAQLKSHLRGSVLLPGQEEYEKAKGLFNIDNIASPALIVQPLGASDLTHIVHFAKEKKIQSPC